MGHHRLRFFLEVVGRKHVIVRRDEGLEEAPGAAGDQPQCSRVRGGERIGAGHGRRTTRPPRDGRRQHPQDHEWSRDRPCPAPDACDDDSGRSRERDAAGHPPVEAAEIEPDAELRLSGGDPLEQPPAPDEQTEERSHDGVGHQPRLMREERDQERDLRQSEREIRADRAPVASLRDPEPSRHDPGESRQKGGQRDRRDDEPAPDRGGSQRQRPSGQQCEEGGRRRQRAAQVVHHLPAADQRNRAFGAGRRWNPAHGRKSRAAIASRRAPTDAGEPRRRRSARETPRRPRCRRPVRPARRFPPADRDSAACSRGAARRGRLRRRRRRRFPCRCRNLRRRDPGTRRRRRRRTGRCRSGPEKTRWKSDPSRPIGNDGVTRGCSTAYPSTTRPAVADRAADG